MKVMQTMYQGLLDYARIAQEWVIKAEEKASIYNDVIDNFSMFFGANNNM